MKKYMTSEPETDDKELDLSKSREADLTIPEAGHLGSPSDSASTLTTPSERGVHTSTSVGVDEEKGRDFFLVDWTEDDPENPRNWSTPKKFFVTFEICLLTTSVYIGSAIYTAGLLGVVEQFGVSEVAAVLGLTLFVIGYAVGPMIWVRPLKG